MGGENRPWSLVPIYFFKGEGTSFLVGLSICLLIYDAPPPSSVWFFGGVTQHELRVRAPYTKPLLSPQRIVYPRHAAHMYVCAYMYTHPSHPLPQPRVAPFIPYAFPLHHFHVAGVHISAAQERQGVGRLRPGKHKGAILWFVASAPFPPPPFPLSLSL